MLSEAKHLSRKSLRRPFDAAYFRTTLLRWYRKNGRDLPWRQTSDPYAIFVSEVMLQQTQVATVIPYYTRWLRQFPSIDALARASELQVLRSWQGLGYYSRARNLHSAAKILKRQYRGVIPERAEELAKLPGAGRYTANAIATFAYDRSVPIVEANIGRVLSRVFNLQTPIDNSAGQEAVWQMAEMLLPKRGALSQFRPDGSRRDNLQRACPEMLHLPRAGLLPRERSVTSSNQEVTPAAKAPDRISLLRLQPRPRPPRAIARALARPLDSSTTRREAGRRICSSRFRISIHASLRHARRLRIVEPNACEQITALVSSS